MVIKIPKEITPTYLLKHFGSLWFSFQQLISKGLEMIKSGHFPNVKLLDRVRFRGGREDRRYRDPNGAEDFQMNQVFPLSQSKAYMPLHKNYQVEINHNK